tara:strand:+ start:62 stop:256 length:195 start_codon:yes stop_codon:yes gene_type:complete
MKSNTKTPGEVITQRVKALNQVIELLLKSIDQTEERDTEHDKVAKHSAEIAWKLLGAVLKDMKC